jgi:predicted Zn-dependent protease
MGKTANKSAGLRLTFKGLSISLTVAGICVLSALASGCNPFSNDWKNHRVAPDASYQTGLQAGNSSRDLLSADHFRSVTVEIQSVRGFGPAQESINRLQKFLENHLNKPGGVNVVLSDDIPAAPAQGTTYSVAQERALEDRYRRQFPQKDQIAVYFLFLDGASPDEGTLGQAYRNTSVAVFENTLRQEAAKYPNLPRWLIETVVMEHEFGHLLGLVNNPISQQSPHEDANHPAHCTEGKCLMYYAADTTAILGSLSGTVPDFESQCLQDLKAAGGK